MQPPQNPYNSYPSPNDPVPPYQSPGVPPRGPEINFDVISQAWTVLQPNLGTYIGAMLIIGVVSAVFNGLDTLVSPRNSSGAEEFSALSIIITLVGLLVNQFLTGGLLRMAITNVKTGRADLGQMFSLMDVFPSFIGAAILMFICLCFGFVLCIVPGLLLSGLFLFVNPLIVDRRMGAIEAISTSVNTLKPQMWMALLFAFVMGLLAGVGICACLIGTLVTVPLATLSIAITYRNFFPDGSGMNFPPQNYPTAPIADPRG